jgi:hypothetical protein
MIWGVDISDYQGTFDMQRLKNEGVDFVILKATEGSTWKSKYFAANYAAAKKAGLLTAAYHYQRSNATAQAQADNIMSVVPQDCGVIPDVEANGGDVNLTRDIMSRVTSKGWGWPLSYIPRWYWQQIGSPSLQGVGSLWQSHYPDNSGTAISEIYQRVPVSYWLGFGGQEIAVLQFTSASTVAGRKPIDGDAFRGSRDQLAALLKQSANAQEDDMPTLDEIWREKLVTVADPADPANPISASPAEVLEWMLCFLVSAAPAVNRGSVEAAADPYGGAVLTDNADDPDPANHKALRLRDLLTEQHEALKSPPSVPVDIDYPKLAKLVAAELRSLKFEAVAPE